MPREVEILAVGGLQAPEPPGAVAQLRQEPLRAAAGPGDLPGVSEAQLQSDVESQLQQAGLKITPGAPSSLTVVVALVTEPACFAVIESSLVEDALLERNGLRVRAQSWHRGASIAGTTDECVRNIPAGVEKTVSDFIEMHRAMNP